MSKPTDIEDARAMQKMGMPLNTPVRTVTFSEEYSKRWLDMLRAHRKLIYSLIAYAEKGEDVTTKDWKRVLATANKLEEKIIHFRDTPPVGREPLIIEWFFQHNIMRFVGNWNALRSSMESGQPTPMTMNTKDLALLDE